MAEEFLKLLEEYRGNYVQFLTSGIPDYERAYKNAQTAIEKILESKREQVDKEKKDMKYFANSYKEDNEDLSGLFTGASTMYEDAQTIQDNYETAKQRYAEFSEKPPQIKDVSNGYKILFRIGLILVLIPCIFLFMYYVTSKSNSLYSSSPSLSVDSNGLV